jgi:spore coat-associated protein N
MSLKMKLGMAVMSSVVGATMIAGGTFAYFNATTSNTNNVFTSGTIKLGQTVNLGTHTNIKPSDSGLDTITLTNLDSTLGSNAIAHFGTLTGTGSGAGNLGDSVAITMTFDGTSVTIPDLNSDGKITYSDLSGRDINLGTFTGGTTASKDVVINWSFPESGGDQNALQGQTLTVPATFEAHQ